MQVWGIGYGAMPKFVKDYTKIYTEEDGVNQVTYGNLLPTSWNIYNIGGRKYLNLYSTYAQYSFEDPIPNIFTQIKYSAGSSAANITLQLGSTPNGSDLYSQKLKNNAVNEVIILEGINTPFYLTLRTYSSGASYGITNFILE